MNRLLETHVRFDILFDQAFQYFVHSTATLGFPVQVVPLEAIHETQIPIYILDATGQVHFALAQVSDSVIDLCV